MTHNLNPEAILRRFHRLTSASKRRYDAAKALPPGTPERAAAVVRFKRFRDRVARPLDARLWPLMKACGMGSDL